VWRVACRTQLIAASARTSDVLALPDSGTGEGVPVQPLPHAQATHRDRACALPHRATDQDLVPEPTHEGKQQFVNKNGKGSPYSITDRTVPELIPVLGSQPAGDVSHKPGGRLPLLSARPAVTPATLKRAATNFAA